MAESYPMNAGDGQYSYTKNSQYQKQGSDSAKDMMKNVIIEKLDMKEILLSSTSTTFSIVDFGCSVGPNTFFTVQNLIDTVGEKCSLQGLDKDQLEFQVFFNDHASNDFNTLFSSLPADRKYHAMGVPGSFYSGRLFPRASISLAHSSLSLHWLSKVPEGLSDPKSVAWNEGRIHYVGSSEKVLKAYADQFEKDIGVFMSARAEEMVEDGLMVLIMLGIPDGVNHAQFPGGFLFNILDSSLMDLVSEEIIDKADVDAFNLPVYAPSIGEMRKLIEKNGCFSIERIEISDPLALPNASVTVSAQGLIMHTRAAIEGILTKHFGSDVVDKIFNKTMAKSDEISRFLESRHNTATQLFIALKRKSKE